MKRSLLPIAALAFAFASTNAQALSVPYSEDFETDPSQTFGFYDRLDNPQIINNWKWVKDTSQWATTHNGYMSLYCTFPDGYNSWLITPALSLEAGKIYKVSLDTWVESRYSSPAVGRFELQLGNMQVPEAMTTVVLPFTDTLATTENNPDTNTAIFTVPTSGIYYLGIHGQQTKALGYTNLFADNLSIEVESTAVAPAQVVDLEAVADINGAPNAQISFKAPTTCNDGSPLAALQNIDIRRDGAFLHTFTNPTPGASLSYTDSDAPEGLHVYSVLATSIGGVSLPAEAEAYIGFATPEAPEWAKIEEVAGQPGKVTVTWAPVSKDIYGKVYPQGAVKYCVMSDEGIQKDNYDGTSVTIDTGSSSEQHFVYYGVFAQTGDRTYSKDYARTRTVPVGPSYGVPFFDSFAEGDTPYAWGFDGEYSVRGTGWGIAVSDAQGKDIDVFDPYDDDNGCLSAGCNNTQEYTWIASGKINTAGLTYPYVSFALWKWGTLFRPDQFELFIRDTDGGEWQLLETYSTGNELSGWYMQRKEIPSEFNGKTIQIAFRYTMDNHYYGFVDAVRVGDIFPHDLASLPVSAPISARSQEGMVVKANVENIGTSPESDYNVTLYLNGKEIASKPGVALDPLAKADFNFDLALEVSDPADCLLTAKVTMASDMNQEDNLSNPVVVRHILPNFPAVNDLAIAPKGGDQYSLTWTKPDVDKSVPETTFDSFEDYDSFEPFEVGNWYLVDNDYMLNYELEDLYFPNNGDRFAYIVMDGKALRKSKLYGRSGFKSMASLPSRLDLNDDWLISPELWQGGQQTVSFWARSLSPAEGPESFEFMVSMDGFAIGSFSRIAEVPEVPMEWTRYSYTLPAGTKHFAIRCVSENKYMFMVDDVEMILEDTPAPELTFIGYNVYRDGVKFTSEPLANPRLDVTHGPGEHHVYSVTALYDKGESRFSNLAYSDPSGVEIVSADVDGEAEYFNLQGLRVENPTDGIFICRKGSNVSKVVIRD